MKYKINISPTAPVPELEEIDISSLVQAFETKGIDIVCVLGPTASGKTHYAVSLARTMNSLKKKEFAEILSADSRQVYKGMDIGSGKDIQEYGEIPYHLIDIVEAGCKYNIYEYQLDFEAAYKEIREQGRLPILCGGSGLYMRTAVEAYSLADVEPDPGLREQLEKTDIGELRRRLSDMNVAEPSGNENRKRLARALEIAYYARNNKVNFSDFKPKKAFFIGLYVSPEKRNGAIDKRLDLRLENGLIEEVRGLMDKGIPADTLSYYGLEYKFVSQYLLGILSYDDMRRMLADSIHRFAKRQMTWYRSMENEGIRIHWINAEQSCAEVPCLSNNRNPRQELNTGHHDQW